jgi:hypothetical protein
MPAGRFDELNVTLSAHIADNVMFNPRAHDQRGRFTLSLTGKQSAPRSARANRAAHHGHAKSAPGEPA